MNSKREVLLTDHKFSKLSLLEYYLNNQLIKKISLLVVCFKLEKLSESEFFWLEKSDQNISSYKPLPIFNFLIKCYQLKKVVGKV